MLNGSIPNRGKRKVFVPRFRRHLKHIDDVDIDDKEAQILIEQDLKGDFRWKSDQNSTDQFEQNQFNIVELDSEQKNNEIDFIGQESQPTIYDFDKDQSRPTILPEELSQNEIYSLDTNNIEKFNIVLPERFDINENNRWTLAESISSSSIDFVSEQCSIEFDSKTDSINEQKINLDSLTNNEKEILLDLNNEQSTIEQFIKDDFISVNIDFDQTSNIRHPSIEFNEQINEKFDFDQDQSEIRLSIVAKFDRRVDWPSSTLSKVSIDCWNDQYLQWSIDFLRKISSNYLKLNIESEYSLIYSLKQEEEEKDFYMKISLTDDLFERFFDVSTRQVNEQIRYDFISELIENNFDLKTNRNEFSPSIDFLDEKQTKTNLSYNEFIDLIKQNFSPDEFIQIYYSLIGHSFDEYFQNIILLDEQFTNGKIFRRYRCKHLSIKNEENIKIDLLTKTNINFEDNFPIGEFSSKTDLEDSTNSRDLIECWKVFDEDFLPCYDLLVNEKQYFPTCQCFLSRSDFERRHPPTNSHLRREIGAISFDGSLEKPIYYFDKSFKRYLYLPDSIEKYQFNSYQGYQQFIEKIRTNPHDYYRQYDATDLRHLLNWYLNNQHLFSTNNINILKKPKFFCRRTVLRTILSNLYCDGQPWKLLVVRINGQFYLSLANRSKREFDQISPNEYSGIAFESRFTSDQPNTTRYNKTFPVEHPLKQFHSVQYWSFGEFDLLYTAEIDCQYKTDVKTTENSKSIEENLPSDQIDIADDSNKEINQSNDQNSSLFRQTSGYVEMKCTNKKIFHQDQQRLQTLQWWAQNWLANIDKIFIGYKTSDDGNVDQFDLLTNRQLFSKFLSKYDLRLNACLSYLYSFLQMIDRTVIVDDPNTVHVFAYIPQQIEIDSDTGKNKQFDLPDFVPFRYTTMDRSNQRHQYFVPQSYIDEIQRIKENHSEKETFLSAKKRFSHRGRQSCPLKTKIKKFKIEKDENK